MRTRPSASLPDVPGEAERSTGYVTVYGGLSDDEFRRSLDGATCVYAVNIDNRSCRFLAECDTLLILHIYLEWMGSGPPAGELTDPGLEALAASKSLVLITIDNESRITDAGLRALMQDERFLYVHVNDCSGVSKDFGDLHRSSTRFLIEREPEPPDPSESSGEVEWPSEVPED